MRPLTKSTRQIVSTATIPTLVRDAFRVAMEERPGPVHLELPEDIAGEETPDIPLVPPHAIELPVAPPAALDRAAAMILAAKRPLVMLGAGRQPAAPRRRAERVHPPAAAAVLHHPDGQGLGRRRRQPLHGHGGAVGARLRARGDRPGRPDPGDRPRHDREAAVHHGAGRAEGDPRRLHAGHGRAGLLPARRGGRATSGPSLALLADRLEGRLPPESPLLPLRQHILARITDRADEDRFPPTPQRIVSDVRKVMPEDGIVALDNGMYKIWFARNYRTRVANTLLLDNALATMGAGLPSAMMAAMLYPRAPRAGGLRRRRLHDEQPGAGDGGPAEAEPRGADPRGQRLRHDPLEAGGRQLRRLGPDLRQPRLRQVRRSLRRERGARRRDRRSRPHARRRVQGRRRAARRGADRLFREHPGAGGRTEERASRCPRNELARRSRP